MQLTLPRHAISRASFFLNLANTSLIGERYNYEAFLEASIVFARASLHHLEKKHKAHSDWKVWWDALAKNESVIFFRKNRDYSLKEGALKLRQHIGFSRAEKALELYSFQDGESAYETVERHLLFLTDLIKEAELKFANNCER